MSLSLPVVLSRCLIAHLAFAVLTARFHKLWPSCSPGNADTFIIRFVCNDDVYPGNPKFLHQDIDSSLGIRNTLFEFETSLACVPSPVDCQVTGKADRTRN